MDRGGLPDKVAVEQNPEGQGEHTVQLCDGRAMRKEGQQVQQPCSEDGVGRVVRGEVRGEQRGHAGPKTQGEVLELNRELLQGFEQNSGII